MIGSALLALCFAGLAALLWWHLTKALRTKVVTIRKYGRDSQPVLYWTNLSVGLVFALFLSFGAVAFGHAFLVGPR